MKKKLLHRLKFTAAGAVILGVGAGIYHASASVQWVLGVFVLCLIFGYVVEAILDMR